MPRRDLARADADEFLQPGDFLFRYADPDDPLDALISGAIIQAGAVTAESTFAVGRLTEDVVNELLDSDGERFDDPLIDGDPSAVHMAVYLGDGQTAEAFGTTADDASVAVWDLFAEYHQGAWRVLRHRDPAVRAAVADVARRWAQPRRMGYRVPTEAFAIDATWGDHARDTARVFASHYDTPGGPPDYGDMFCPQFAIASLQSASARVAGASDSIDALPREARIDAIASPLRAYGYWMRSGAFEVVGHIRVVSE